jgi:GDP-mannose mannosyl hydrolase
MFLDSATFATVVGSTPLVAIDLLVVNEDNELLLGKRLNRPAKDIWFVPGGRVLKNEPLEQTFKRITLAELGNEIDLGQAKLLGLFEHFYEDSVFGEHINTHYVIAAHQYALCYCGTSIADKA